MELDSRVKSRGEKWSIPGELCPAEVHSALSRGPVMGGRVMVGER